jgi:Flp pilus assembly protein TadG
MFRRARQEDDGAAALEFGIIAPVLVLLVFGIMSFGLLFAQTLSMDNAARQGARFGAVGERTCSALITETRTASATIGVNTSNVTVKILRGQSLGSATDITGVAPCSNTSPAPSTPCYGSAPGDNVYVRASYQSRLLIPLFKTGDFTVGGTGVFRCEYNGA